MTYTIMPPIVHLSPASGWLAVGGTAVMFGAAIAPDGGRLV